MTALRRHDGDVELTNGTVVRVVVDLEPADAIVDVEVVDVGSDEAGRRLGYVATVDRLGRHRSCSPIVVVS